MTHFKQPWIQDFRKVGSTASTGCEPTMAEVPRGVQGQNPWWGYFWSIFIQKRSQKVNDLNDGSPPCLRQTASLSHDKPLLLVNVGSGCPVRN